ncbi:hypothetical protein SAMN06265338_12615 [Rhodoblastus acidophilus]|uniref:Uncharacterized protein n=1 Tax=Rhodoblastus acidophilus TaxID=1074 RepID=A0A212SCS1_RHOAC|nr:hypothetical protein [Rhodoblastus acidophilus]SNB83369.1 hypothetical protein SAMN06265338_12615 [Rhodoblastus acidophilus]
MSKTTIFIVSEVAALAAFIALALAYVRESRRTDRMCARIARLTDEARALTIPGEHR